MLHSRAPPTPTLVVQDIQDDILYKSDASQSSLTLDIVRKLPLDIKGNACCVLGSPHTYNEDIEQETSAKCPGQNVPPTTYTTVIGHLREISFWILEKVYFPSGIPT